MLKRMSPELVNKKCEELIRVLDTPDTTTMKDSTSSRQESQTTGKGEELPEKRKKRCSKLKRKLERRETRRNLQ